MEAVVPPWQLYYTVVKMPLKCLKASSKTHKLINKLVLLIFTPKINLDGVSRLPPLFVNNHEKIAI